MKRGIWDKSLLFFLLTSFIALAQTPMEKDKGKEKKESNLPLKSLKQWVQDLRNTDPSVRDFALVAIPNLGISTTEAIPAIADRCIDSEASVRVKAIMALAILEILDKDVPRVVDALIARVQTDPQAQNRFLAIGALTRFDQADGKKSLSALIKATEDKTSYEIRRAALGAMVQMTDRSNGPDPKSVRAALVALKDSAKPVRYAAINSIAMLGPPNDATLANSVIKSLNDLAQGSDKIFALWAKIGLVGMDNSNAPMHMQYVVRVLKQGDGQIKAEAMRAVMILGPMAKSAVPDLIDILPDKDYNLVFLAIGALANIGKDAKAAVEPLQKLATTKDIPEGIKQAANHSMNLIKGVVVQPVQGK